VRDTGVKCPKDGGAIVERRGRFRPFYGCVNYPACDFSLNARPIPQACPKCGNPYLAAARGKGGSVLALRPRRLRVRRAAGPHPADERSVPRNDGEAGEEDGKAAGPQERKSLRGRVRARDQPGLARVDDARERGGVRGAPPVRDPAGDGHELDAFGDFAAKRCALQARMLRLTNARRISDRRSASYAAAFSRVVHPCQTRLITRSYATRSDFRLAGRRLAVFFSGFSVVSKDNFFHRRDAAGGFFEPAAGAVAREDRAALALAQQQGTGCRTWGTPAGSAAR